MKNNPKMVRASIPALGRFEGTVTGERTVRMVAPNTIKRVVTKRSDNLIPKFCPIDGSPLELMDNTLVCEAESHNWELELGEEPNQEFYTLRLSGY